MLSFFKEIRIYLGIIFLLITHPPNSDEGNDGDGGLTESRVSQNRDVPNGSGGDEGNQSTNSDF